MKAVINREAFAAAYAVAAPVAPSRSPKPILQNLLLVADGDGCTLVATDLEVGVRRSVAGVDVESPGRAILPTAKLGAILKSSGDDAIRIEATADEVRVLGARSSYRLPAEDPELYPDVPAFDAAERLTLAADDLRALIRRTVYATDLQAARYAFGGVLMECEGGRLVAVGTDGRRLARAKVAAEGEGWTCQVVVPVKALRLIERVADGAGSVEIAADAGKAQVRTDLASVYTRLVEGRFPRYQDVFPTSPGVVARIGCGSLRRAVERAAITTSETTRGVSLTFESGRLTLESNAADVGESRVEELVEYEGAEVKVSVDPRYLSDALKAAGDDVEAAIRLIDGKEAVVMEMGEGFVYVVMPLTLGV